MKMKFGYYRQIRGESEHPSARGANIGVSQGTVPSILSVLRRSVNTERFMKGDGSREAELHLRALVCMCTRLIG